MAIRTCVKVVATAIFSVGLFASVANAQQAQSGVVGKDGWLFSNWELFTSADIPPTNISLDLIRQLNKVFVANGVTMVMSVIPAKMRTYSEFLPPSVRIGREMEGQYDRLLKGFEKGHVNAIDLNSAFHDKANRSSPFPLFLKLDSHWSPTGVLLAAETIKAGIAANPSLKSALDATPIQQYKLEMSKSKKRSSLRDLVAQLPPAEAAKQTFQPDEMMPFKAVRVKGDVALNSQASYGVALVGSSSSGVFTGFLDALQYALQRDIFLSSTDGDRGSWVGMETYLRSNAFQTKPPRLVIWEQTEKQLPMPPTYKWRSATFNVDNTEWLLRAAALVQKTCKPSPVVARLSTSGLAAASANQKNDGVSVGATSDGEFVEYSFSEPLGKLDYLSAQLTITDAKSITLEASGADGVTRKFIVAISPDGPFKYPITSPGKGYSKVRIYPGKTGGFALKGLQVCRQPDDLLS